MSVALRWTRLVGVVALIGLRELARRRLALGLILALPLIFYVVRLDVPWQAVRFLSVGVGWAVATLALFVHVGARGVDQRLTTVGASPSAVFLGRQSAVLAAGLAVATVSLALAVVTQSELVHPWALALLLVTTVLLAAPSGALISLVLPRELEGALALLAVFALQILVDPDAAAGWLLPLWSTRELAGYALGGEELGSLSAGLWHVTVFLVILVAAAWAAAVWRLRPIRLDPISPED